MLRQFRWQQEHAHGCSSKDGCILSPNSTQHNINQFPDTLSLGPWATEIATYVSNEHAIGCNEIDTLELAQAMMVQQGRAEVYRWMCNCIVLRWIVVGVYTDGDVDV